MKYYLLSNSLVVIDNGETHTISSGDRRYEKIKQEIENKNFDQVKNLLQPKNIIGGGFDVCDGLIRFKKQPIPAVLGNKFLELTKDSWEFKSLFNFWYNMTTRVDSQKASEIISKLVDKKAYAVTEDGFYLVYEDKEADQTNSTLNKKNQAEYFNFYNYAKCPTAYQSYFENKKSIDYILEEIFGFVTKKLKKIALSNLFTEDSNFLNYRFFFYGEAFKNVLAVDNIFFAIENKIIDITLGDISDYKELNKLLQDLSQNKDGTYSQKKIINFLKGCKNKEQIVEIGNYYSAVKNEFKIDIQELKTNNFVDIYEYLQREYQRIEDPVFFLNNDSAIDCLSEVEFENFKILIPQTNHDLKKWGVELHNCLATYAKRVKEKDCQIIGIAKKESDKLLYGVEIARKNIIQFRGKRNCSPTSYEKSVVESFLKKNNLIYNE